MQRFRAEVQEGLPFVGKINIEQALVAGLRYLSRPHARSTCPTRRDDAVFILGAQADAVSGVEVELVYRERLPLVVAARK